MASVSISISGRQFDIDCDDGQEGRVLELAAYIDQKLQTIARGSGAFNDSHLLVLTALVLADELFDARNTNAQAAHRGEKPAPTPAAPVAAPSSLDQDERQALVKMLDQLTKRIDGIAEKVQAA